MDDLIEYPERTFEAIAEFLVDSLPAFQDTNAATLRAFFAEHDTRKQRRWQHVASSENPAYLLRKASLAKKLMESTQFGQLFSRLRIMMAASSEQR